MGIYEFRSIAKDPVFTILPELLAKAKEIYGPSGSIKFDSCDLSSLANPYRLVSSDDYGSNFDGVLSNEYLVSYSYDLPTWHAKLTIKAESYPNVNYPDYQFPPAFPFAEVRLPICNYGDGNPQHYAWRQINATTGLPYSETWYFAYHAQFEERWRIFDCLEADIGYTYQEGYYYWSNNTGDGIYSNDSIGMDILYAKKLEFETNGNLVNIISAKLHCLTYYKLEYAPIEACPPETKYNVDTGKCDVCELLEVQLLRNILFNDSITNTQSQSDYWMSSNVLFSHNDFGAVVSINKFANIDYGSCAWIFGEMIENPLLLHYYNSFTTLTVGYSYLDLRNAKDNDGIYVFFGERKFFMNKEYLINHSGSNFFVSPDETNMSFIELSEPVFALPSTPETDRLITEATTRPLHHVGIYATSGIKISIATIGLIGYNDVCEELFIDYRINPLDRTDDEIICNVDDDDTLPRTPGADCCAYVPKDFIEWADRFNEGAI